MIFEEREKITFSLIKETKKITEIVIIGGYAVNAYTLPRFSVDCDVVVKDNKSLTKLQKFLESRGFKKKAEGKIPAYKGEFLSLAIKKPVLATFDILSRVVEDRITGTIFPAETIFKYSSIRTIFGKGSPISLQTRVVDSEMLFVMKAISSRKPDIRDVFMLASTKLDNSKLSEILKALAIPKQSTEKIFSTVNSTGFKDSLQGVFGMLQEKEFERTKKRLFSMPNFRNNMH